MKNIVTIHFIFFVFPVKHSVVILNLFKTCLAIRLYLFKCFISSNGRHSGTNFFKPEKNLEFFRLKICARDAVPGKLE